MQMMWVVLCAWCQHTVLLCKADVMLSFQGRLFAEGGTLLIVLLIRLSRYLFIFFSGLKLEFASEFPVFYFWCPLFPSWVKCYMSHFSMHAEGNTFVPTLSVCTAGTVGHRQIPGTWQSFQLCAPGGGRKGRAV